MEKRNIVVDLKTVEAETLNSILRKFYAEVRTVKNEVLTPSSMTGIRAAIYRTILSPPYSRNMNILADREFSTANEMFSAKCKLYYKTHNKKPQHKAAIEQADMNKLQIYFVNCLDDPVKLQEYVWFNLCLHFGRRGREGWRELQKEHFEVLSSLLATTKVMLPTLSDWSHALVHKGKVQVYAVRISSLDTSTIQRILCSCPSCGRGKVSGRPPWRSSVRGVSADVLNEIIKR